jgi:hypothetical protein
VSEVPLPEQFRTFAESCERDGAVTYATICRNVATDAGLLELMAQAPLSQRRPNLLLAAVHFLLLGGDDHPLGTHYDTVAAIGGTAPVAPVGEVGAEFKDFCATHRAELLALIDSGSTQTNEVGRCTALLPALSHIARAHDHQPIALLDLGTSAGLNLQFDRYAYRYHQRAGSGTGEAGTGSGVEEVIEAGEPGSTVRLECSVRGSLDDLPSLALPAMAGRAGLDRAPVDPHDPVGSLWLLACLWPDHLPRFERLRSALDIARHVADPPALHTGDMIDQLFPVAATVAPDSPLVVFHSWVAAYLSAARQAELAAAVRDLAASSARPVHHLYAESPVETPGLPTPPSPEPGPTSDVATVLVHVPPGAAPIRLADMHHHGRSLGWWAGR